MNNVNKNFNSYFHLNVSIIMLDSEFMNLQDKLYEKFFSISNDLTINANVLQPIYISNNKLFD